jgi:hypothetical protein
LFATLSRREQSAHQQAVHEDITALSSLMRDIGVKVPKEDEKAASAFPTANFSEPPVGLDAKSQEKAKESEIHANVKRSVEGIVLAFSSASICVVHFLFETIILPPVLTTELLNMDHPDFVGEHWLDTFRNHVQEIHKRGHRLSVRQAPLDMAVVMKAFEGSNSKFDVSDEVITTRQISFFSVTNARVRSQDCRHCRRCKTSRTRSSR